MLQSILCLVPTNAGTESSEASSMVESGSYSSLNVLSLMRRPSILSFSIRRSNNENRQEQDGRRLSLGDKEPSKLPMAEGRSKSVSNFSR